MFGKRKYNRGRISGRRQQWILGGFHNILNPNTEGVLGPDLTGGGGGTVTCSKILDLSSTCVFISPVYDLNL